MGIGKKRTPNAFINACEIFIYSEDLLARHKALSQQNVRPSKQNGQKSDSKDKSAAAQTKIATLLQQAFHKAVQPDGRVYLGTLGLHLQKLEPGFEPRNYGFKQLSQLVRAQNGLFETEIVESRIYIRINGNGAQ